MQSPDPAEHGQSDPISQPRKTPVSVVVAIILMGFWAFGALIGGLAIAAALHQFNQEVASQGGASGSDDTDFFVLFVFAVLALTSCWSWLAWKNAQARPESWPRCLLFW